MIWFTILGILLVVLSYLNITRNPRTKTQMTSLGPSDPGSLAPTEHARMDQLIAEALVGQVITNSPLTNENRQSLQRLGPSTRKFFEKYGNVQLHSRNLSLEVGHLNDAFIENFLSIGHSADWDIVQEPGSDRVYIVEGSEVSASQMDIEYPTVFHLLVDELRAAQSSGQKCGSV